MHENVAWAEIRVHHAAAVDVVNSLSNLSAPFQALADVYGWMVVVEVRLEVAMAGFT
jgi:hypothetical protein